jgi:alanine dehydrogenase
MALLIREQEVADLISMSEATDVVQEAFTQLGEGRAFHNPRTRMKLGGEMLHVLPAALPEMDAVGLKSYTAFRGGIRFLVLLYSAKTGELKAMVEAQRLGELRTGGAASVAIKKMARKNVERGVLFGAGVMGGAMLEGMVNARKFDQISVFDLNGDRLKPFCEEMSRKLDVDIVPASDANEAVSTADVVVTMTTSKEPVFDGKRLPDGATVVAAGSNLLQKREIDSTVIRRSSRIVVEAKDQAQLEAGDLFVPIDAGHLHWNQIYELSDVLLKRVPARESEEEINLFKSVGLGLQDVAVAAKIYDCAVKNSAGVELPITFS